MRIKYAESYGGKYFYYIQIQKKWLIFTWWARLTYKDHILGAGDFVRPVKFDTCQEADQYVCDFYQKAKTEEYLTS